MKKLRRSWVLLLLLSSPLNADYLEVRRDAIFKESPERDATEITRLSDGDQVHLLDNGETTNNYYRAYLPSLNQTGWIYRTLVRRHAGDLPGMVLPSADGVAPVELTGADVMRAHFINVDQGNATLLEFSCGLVLIDAGGRTAENTEHLLGYIQSVMSERGYSAIDAIFITHTHTDHNLSLQAIVESIPVRNYIHNGVLTGSGRFKATWMVNEGNTNGRSIAFREVAQSEIEALSTRTGLKDEIIDPLQCEGVDPDIKVVRGLYEENTAGWPDGVFENGNNMGIVIRVDYGATSFLFTGDLEDQALDTLAEFYAGTDTLDVDVYEVGHHGSANGTNNAILEAMSPEVAVISFGPSTIQEQWTAWAYGHPRQSIISMLDTWIDRPRLSPKSVEIAPGTKTFIPFLMKDAIYGTGWDGTVILEGNAAGQIVVKTER